MAELPRGHDGEVIPRPQAPVSFRAREHGRRTSPPPPLRETGGGPPPLSGEARTQIVIRMRETEHLCHLFFFFRVKAHSLASPERGGGMAELPRGHDGEVILRPQAPVSFRAREHGRRTSPPPPLRETGGGPPPLSGEARTQIVIRMRETVRLWHLSSFSHGTEPVRLCRSLKLAEAEQGHKIHGLSEN